MRLLIDTQVLIWFQLNDTQLPFSIRLLIEDPAHDVFVSPLSFMEVTIKQTVNRLSDFTVSTEELADTAQNDGFLVLPVSLSHIVAYRQIPFYADHRDLGPSLRFDRLILATALAEAMPVISADEKFQRYRPLVDVIW